MNKKRIFDILQIGKKDDFLSRSFDYFITFVIILNLFLTFFLTFDLPERVLSSMRIIEWLTMVIFTIEYCLRLYSAEYLYPKLSKKQAKIKYVYSFYGIIDLLTILPYWLPFETIYGMGTFRIIRVFRIFHLFKVNSQSDAYHVIISVIREKRGQLLSSLSIIGMLMLSASFMMYSVEHQVQPEVFDNAFSGLWWSVSTVLTVGYGDIYPITTLGKAMAIVISLCGVMATAIPTGILSAGFSEKYHESRMKDKNINFVIHVNGHSQWIGMEADDLYYNYNIYVKNVLRGDERLRADDTIIEEGDILLCVNEES